MEKEKTKKTGLIVTLSLLVTLLVATSYALFTNSFNGTKTPTIDTNDLIFNYNETSNSVTLTDATSYTDSEGLINGGSFTFDVSASSTKEQNVYYTIYLTEEVTNTMDSSYIKLALLDNSNNTLVGPIPYKNLSNSTKKANAKILYMNEINLTSQNNVKQNYVLKYWVDSKIEELTTTTEGNKQTVSLNGGEFKFKVNVMRTAESGAKALIKKVGTDGIVAESHPATEQLIATTSYRYTGANPNNYVRFNSELWRIIGVFDVDNGTGHLEKRIKIIINESIGDIAWNNSNGDNSINDWSKATGMTLLNSGDYWNRTGDYASNGLTPEAKQMIGNSKWYLGGTGNYTSASNGLASHFYGYERGITVYGNIRPTSWTGKIALMYPSDFGYATSGGTTTNRQACLAKEMYNWYHSEVSDCRNNNWLFNIAKSNNIVSSKWTLSPYSGDSNHAFNVSGAGFVRNYNVDHTSAFLPSVYLSSDIEIIGGTGTESDPYILR